MPNWLRLAIAVVIALFLLYSVARTMYFAGQRSAIKKVLKIIESIVPSEILSSAKAEFEKDTGHSIDELFK